MKLSWMSESKVKPKTKKKVVEDVEGVRDFEVEKMIDFASSYFFTKMEQKPNNILSFYDFGEEGREGQFGYEKEREKEMFGEYVQRKKRGEGNGGVLSEQVSRSSILEKSSSTQKGKEKHLEMDQPSILRVQVSDEESIKSSKYSGSSSKKSNPLKNQRDSYKAITSSNDTNNKVSMDFTAKVKKSTLPIKSNQDLNEINNSQDSQASSAFKKQKQGQNQKQPTSGKKTPQPIEKRSEGGNSQRSSQKSMSSFHPNESYESSDEQEVPKVESRKQIQVPKDAGFKKQKAQVVEPDVKQHNSSSKNPASNLTAKKQETQSNQKTDKNSNANSTTGKKNQWEDSLSKPNSKIPSNELNFEIKGLSSSKNNALQPKQQNKPTQSPSPLKDAKSESSQSSSEQQPEPETESSKCYEEMNLDQLSDANDSDLFPQRKFSKLHQIEQLSQNLSTLRTDKYPPGKLTTQMKKEISNISRISKTKSSNEDMKTLLELERIQLAIDHLDGKFQDLMNYELKFPKLLKGFAAVQPQKQKRRLKLGIVIDFDQKQR